MASEKEFVYIRIDVLPEVLGNDQEYPLWAFDPNWIETHKDEFESIKHMVDRTTTVMPSVESLLSKFGNLKRTYIDTLPKPAKARPSAPSGSASSSVYFNPQTTRPTPSTAALVNPAFLAYGEQPGAYPGIQRPEFPLGKLSNLFSKRNTYL